MHTHSQKVSKYMWLLQQRERIKQTSCRGLHARENCIAHTTQEREKENGPASPKNILQRHFCTLQNGHGDDDVDNDTHKCGSFWTAQRLTRHKKLQIYVHAYMCREKLGMVWMKSFTLFAQFARHLVAWINGTYRRAYKDVEETTKKLLCIHSELSKDMEEWWLHTYWWWNSTYVTSFVSFSNFSLCGKSWIDKIRAAFKLLLTSGWLKWEFKANYGYRHFTFDESACVKSRSCNLSFFRLR